MSPRRPSAAGTCLRWSFSDEVDWTPALTLEMDSAVANRYLQGRVNFAIAVARGEIRVSCAEAAAPIAFLPVSAGLIARYRAIVEADYPASADRLSPAPAAGRAAPSVKWVRGRLDSGRPRRMLSPQPRQKAAVGLLRVPRRLGPGGARKVPERVP